MWPKSRYTKRLEIENEQLKVEVAHAHDERRAAVNSLLSHLGAPTVDVNKPDGKPAPEQKRRYLPSLWRAAQERVSRQEADKERMRG